MLTGEYNHQLDAKNRIRIPAKLKKELGDEYYFTKGTSGCIFIMPKETVDAQLEVLKQIPISDPRQEYVRKLSKSFVSAEEDNQGRIVLNPVLRKYAKIDKDVVFIGAVTRVEIWAKEVYDAYFGGEVNVDDVYAQLGL
jgi:MraZ protein